jgi:uncharacterized LabA/DUF88 family protein
VSKNVAVFVDVANIFYAAKAAGVDIDYVTLLKSATAGRDLVRAYAYTGLDPDNENQRNFHSFLARHGFKVVSKDIRKYGDGKVKANLDIELVVDMMKTARNLDIAIVVSGDGDFAPAIRAVQEMGVRVEVISFRGNTSSDLIDVADQFTDITALARVEKGSSRSGRRVAGDDQDLSMTEVPDKQTEGSTTRGRGRGRTRGKVAEPAAEAASPGRRRRSAAPEAAPATTAAGLVALPGEKLSRAASAADDEVAVQAADTGDGATTEWTEIDAETFEGEGGTRRRRRRGGRGRGRGRGRSEEVVPAAGDAYEEDQPPVIEAPRPPRVTPFGSVWDSQLGVPATRDVTPLPDDEDLDEPEIPEYLIAERRRDRGGRAGGRMGGARGGARGGYAAAVERERYGRGSSGGINRYPDVGGRDRAGRDRGGRGGGREPGFSRPPRQDRPDRVPGRGSGSSEPWSEVPPELEAMLRAQIQSKPRPEKAAPGPEREPEAVDAAVSGVPASPPRRRTARPTAAESTADQMATVVDGEADSQSAEPKKPTRRRATAAGGGTATAKRPARRAAGAKAGADADTEATDTPVAAKRTTRRRSTTSATGDEAAADAPKRRTTRRSVAADEAPAD